MPTRIVTLPLEPEVEYIKPTIHNTNGGKTYKPTHPDLFRVEFSANPDNGEYSSSLIALQDFPPNSTIVKLDNLSLAKEKAYSSVQFGLGPKDHFELNTDLLFMNHSCTPTAEVHLPSKQPDQWEIRSSQNGIKKGEEMTFFYPSTEWDMAQGFQCNCQAGDCLGMIKGAKYISIEELERRALVNDHIRFLKLAQSNLDEKTDSSRKLTVWEGFWRMVTGVAGGA